MMQIYDARSLFREPEVDTEALIEFLSDLGERKGWDDEQVGLHARFAVHTHATYGMRMAIKYLDSLL